MRFLGIDLGWKSGASGLCCLEWRGEELVLLSLERRLEIQEILGWVKNWTTPNLPALVAVDAPTLIPNSTGTRLPDRLTHKYFGKYHAGCYPANLQRPFATRTVDFGCQLEKAGFHHAPQITPCCLDRYQIEVFPHPAQVNLFNLDRILKYKKGSLQARSLELAKLRNYILQVLTTLEPKLAPLDLPEIPSQGKAMKELEDQLDSLICAYVGAYWWYWGAEKNLVLGDETTGYIVVPARLTPSGASLS
jgi:predicted RNase H-like nuclease